MTRKVRNIIRFRTFSLICLFISLVLSLFGTMFSLDLLSIISFFLISVFLIISFILWRCPSCKVRLPLRFDKYNDFNYTYVCPHCKTRFYDDGTMEEK
ncbi:membrane protein required for beta-lactamase induction [Bacillus luteolus]|nr:membrane protein required for beta-lactamase induction [Cytobacillus luteolus]